MNSFFLAGHAFLVANMQILLETDTDDSFVMWLSMILCAIGLAVVLVKHRKK